MLKLLIATFALLQASATIASSCPEAFNTEVRKLHSKDSVNLCELFDSGKAMLMVNTASHCGFTKQFGDLEALHKKYADKGLVVVGVPSNDFKQEEKSEEGTARVCYQNYGVTFVMTEHADVKGRDAHPAFAYLASKSKAPSWNFNKYLITNDGTVKHFGSTTKPLDSKLEKAVVKSLKI